MLRLYFLQQWLTLSDEVAGDSVVDSQAMREFVGIDLARGRMPDATTLLKFPRSLGRHQLGEAILREANAPLAEEGCR